MTSSTGIFGACRSPRNLVFGAGQRRSLPQYVAALDRRALVVTDARLAGQADFRAMGLAAGCTVAERATAAIDGVAALFAAVGITRPQLPQVVELALGGLLLVKNNPRPLDTPAMTILVEAAFSGNRSGFGPGLAQKPPKEPPQELPHEKAALS